MTVLVLAVGFGGNWAYRTLRPDAVPPSRSACVTAWNSARDGARRDELVRRRVARVTVHVTREPVPGYVHCQVQVHSVGLWAAFDGSYDARAGRLDRVVWEQTPSPITPGELPRLARVDNASVDRRGRLRLLRAAS